MERIDSDQLDSWIWHRDRFPRPDWEAIGRHIHGSLKECDWQEAWGEAGRRWVDETRKQLKGEYEIRESKNFFLLADLDEKTCGYLLGKAEESLAVILRTLGEAADDSGYGKHVVMCFSDEGDAVDYFIYFYGSDAQAVMPAGVFLNSGYGHVVINYRETFDAVRTIGHELAHACLRHRTLPTWLNEGIALNIEELVCEESWGSSLNIDRELKQKHLDYWDVKSIQGFWTGKSFGEVGDPSNLSYNMAAILSYRIGHEFGKLAELVVESDYSDYGASGCAEILGMELSDLVAGFLGEGDWGPIVGECGEGEAD